MAKKLKVYNGTSWEDVTFAITPPNTAVTNAFTTNQVIDASTSVAALRVTQRGSGEAFRVEDETNPDSSPFVINADGLVGIGTADFSFRPSTNIGSRIVTNGGFLIVNYGDDSSITIARANGTSSSPTQVLANQRIAFFIGSSYGSSSFNNNVGINFHAAENITDSARGSYITFDTTTIGTVGRAERIRIDSSGNVGIGTSTPQQKLSVTGNIHMNGGTGTGISWAADQSSHYLKFDSGLNGIKLQGYAGIVFETLGQNERMRIDSSGYVGINTSTMGSRHLTVNGNTAIWGQMPLRLGEGNNTYYYDMGRDGASGNFVINGNQVGAAAYVWQIGSVEKLRLSVSGDLSTSSGKVLVNSPASVTGANWQDAMLHLTGINDAASNPGMTWHAPGASAMSLFHVRGTQALEVRGNANIMDTASGRMTIRNIAVSTSTPSGGLDGDMWATYV